jgi:hypothetical protein
MEGVMTVFKAGANRFGTRPKVRTAVRSLDHEIAIARWCILAAAFTTLLVVMVLAHVGG